MSTRSNPTAVHPGAPIRPAGATQLAPRQIVGGLGALGILAIGLVGIPLILALVVGWPLPHQVPTGAEMVHALGGAIPDSFWPRLFATLAWLAWVYFVVSVGTSLVLQLRGRRVGCRPRLVGSGTVAALIGAALVLGQLRGAQGVVHPSGSRSLASRASVVQLLARTSSGAAFPLAIVPISADASSITPATQRTTVTHIVVPGDTLWSIAVQYYGDGEHWQTIFEANVGRLQPGGATLSDAHWIYPGWSLAIPGVTLATPVSPAIAPPSGAAVPVAPSVIPSPGASGSPNGAANAGVTRARSALGINRGNNGPVATRPSQPLASATIPPLATHHATHATPSGAPSPRPSLTLHHRSATSPTHADGSIAAGTLPARPRLPGSDVGPLAMGAGLFGLSAIGLVGALDRRRRRQRGRRTIGGRIPRPAPQSPLADLELQLRHYARAREVFWLCHLAQLLGHAADVAGVAPPAVMGVEIVRDGLDVLVPGEETVPLSPFVDQADRPSVWHLPFATEPGVIDEAVASPPAPVVLATVGQGARGALAVNVSYYRSIHLVVPPERAEGTLGALATELAGTTAPAGTSVVAVGFGYGVIDRLDGGVVLDDLQAAATMTLHHQGAIVLVDPRTTTDRLLDALSGTGEVHLVTAGPLAPEGTALIIDPDHPCLEDHPCGPIVSSHVSDDTLEVVQALFELAEEDPGTAAHENGEESELASPDDGDSEGVVVIGLLGEPTISVGGGDLQDLVTAVTPTAGTRAHRVVELLVYLAAHGGSATRGEWLTDISPDKALSDGYVRNLVLLTRRSLAAITGDANLLGYDKATQRLFLAERVTTDWSQFHSAASAGDPGALQMALELVRGAPFGADPDPWTSAGGLSYVVGDAITDAALTLGESALDDGDPRLATWAARRGQLANRYDQGLWRILLRAADDDAARRQIWNELHALLAVDGDPAGDLEPATLDLYRSLCVPRRPASEVIVLQDDDDAVLPTRQAV